MNWVPAAMEQGRIDLPLIAFDETGHADAVTILAVRGEAGLDAMYALLMTYADNGGHAIHFNVLSPDTLRDAQAHPEKHRDLQIRVCGWNVLWNNLSPAEQAFYIRQAEAAQ